MAVTGINIRLIATTLYGAGEVYTLPAAGRKLAELERRGYGELPVCMAKTPLSLSHDPKLVGRPAGFALPIFDPLLQLAQAADRLGFTRYWVAEHHNMPSVGATSPPVVIRPIEFPL